MIDKFTTTMQTAIAEAQQIAITRQQQQIDIPHLWLVFLQLDHFAYNLYQELGVQLNNLKRSLKKKLINYRLSQVQPSNMDKVLVRDSSSYWQMPIP